MFDNPTVLKVQRSALSVAGGRRFGKMVLWISCEFCVLREVILCVNF